MTQRYEEIDTLTAHQLKLELAKNGLKIADSLDGMSKAQILDQRNALRKTINDMSARAENAIKRGDNAEADRLMNIADGGRVMINNLQYAMDLRERDAEADNAFRGPANSFTSATGNRIHLLDKADKFADLTRNGSTAEYGIGEYLASMVGKNSSQAIRNDLAEGADSTGGATVPTYLVGKVIDQMRSRMVAIKAGAKTLALETQTTKIARLASDPTAGWRLEAGVVAASEPTFDTVTFTARSLAVKFEVSAELFDDSVNINDAIMAALSGSLAVELDRVCLFGSGSAPEPMGIFGQTGVNSVSMGAAGATPTSYSQLLDCLYELELDNAATPTAMVMHPRTRRTFSGFVDTTNQPLQLPPTLASIPQLVTTSVPITQTVGASGAVCSSVIVGDYTQLILGVRQGLRIEVLKSSKYSSNLQYTFLAHLRADVAVAQPKAFCKLIGIKA